MKDDELDRSLEAALGPASAPRLPDRARFVDHVMQRVLIAEREAPRQALQSAAPVPWWARAAADPAAALACALVALLLWRPEAPAAVTRLFARSSSLLAWPAIANLRAALEMDRPAIALGLGLLGILLLGWASFQLYGWTERLARRAARI
jgi:hypothetical protein